MPLVIPGLSALAAATGLLAASLAAAVAQEVRDCDTPLANARNLAQPYAEATRSFAEGRIALLSLQQEEPACCGAHLMVLLPVADEPFQDCRIVTTAQEQGWAALDLVRAGARYDPALGLTVSIPARRMDAAGAISARLLEVRIDQARGAVTAQERAAR